LTNIWKFEIIPLLQEYFYDSPEKLLYITNNRFFEKRGSSFILKTEGDLIEVLRAVATTK
jgi:5-methylcytosine-specific restriction protein B